MGVNFTELQRKCIVKSIPVNVLGKIMQQWNSGLKVIR